MKTETMPITTPVDKLNSDVTFLSTNVLSFIIEDKFTYDLSLEYLVPLTDMRKRIVDYFKDMKKKAFEAHKSITSQEKQELEKISLAEKYIRGERGRYKMEQDRLDEIERQKAETIAKAEADKECEKLLEEAANAPEEKQEELFEKAEDVYVPPVLLDKSIEKTSRTATASVTWIKDIETTVTSVKLLCGAIASGQVPESLVEFKKLKAWVKMNAIRPGQIPGLDIKETQREVVR